MHTFIGVSVDSSETFGVSNTRSLFYYLTCYSTYTNLSQCIVNTKSSYGCYLTSPSTCYTEYGLTCTGKPTKEHNKDQENILIILCLEPEEECENGDIRLAGGLIEQEGRPEVCFDGVWGTICSYSWSSTDGYIFCKTLGYNGQSNLMI